MSSEPPSTLSWILSITLLNKQTEKLIQLMVPMAHTVFSSSTLPALVEETALKTTDGLVKVKTPHFQLTVIISLSHSLPLLLPMHLLSSNLTKRNPKNGLNSQPALESKTRSILPRTLVTPLLPTARRTQPIHQTHPLTQPLLLLIASPLKLNEMKKSHSDRGKKSLLKLKSNIIQKSRGRHTSTFPL